MRIQDLSSFNAVKEAGLAKLMPYKPRIGVGMGTCGSGNGAEGVYHAFVDDIERRGLDVQLGARRLLRLLRAGAAGERVAARPAARRFCGACSPNNVPHILDELYLGKVPAELALCKIEEWDHLTGQVKYGSGYPEIPSWREVPFFRGQKKIVLRNCGLISADDIEEYIAVGGYQSLYKVLIDNTPDSSSSRSRRQAARTRRRGLPHGPEVGSAAQGQGREEIRHLQCR